MIKNQAPEEFEAILKICEIDINRAININDHIQENPISVFSENVLH